MAEKDIAEKTLFDYPDVCADVMNVLLFHGRKIVSAEEMEVTGVRSQYKIEEDLHEETRDCLKIWQKDGEILSFVGMEQETESEMFIPIRVIGYDGASYLGEIVRKREEDRQRRKEKKKTRKTVIVPVMTMVLHYGMEKWKYGRHLKDVLRIPRILRRYISDYTVNVFDISWLTPKQVSKFESDYYVVADYFVQMRMKGKYEPSTKEIIHVDTVLKLMTVLTGTDWRSEVIQKMKKEGKEITMVSAYAEVEKRGYENGVQAAELRMKSQYAEVEKRGYENGVQATELRMKSQYAEVEKRGYENGVQAAELRMKSQYAEVEKRGYENGVQATELRMKSQYAEAESKARKNNAMMMLKDNKLSLEDISRYSGLSLAEVEELKKNLK